MFLVAFTKEGITQNFQSVKVEEIPLHSSKITIITDNFLSKFFSEPDGFSVIESPLINTPDFQNIIFSKVTYNSIIDNFNIFKSTISGRPIYYHFNSKGEFFCSTHISLLRAAGVPIKENNDVIPEFFVFRFVMPPNTLYKDIYQLFPGSQLQIKIKNSTVNRYTFSDYVPPKHRDKSKIKDITEQTIELLNTSIWLLNSRKQKISVLLSGGLDSSILFKICQDTFQTDTTFSTGFPFEDTNKNLEKEYSLSAADLFHTKHHYFEMSSNDYLRGFLEAISKAEVPMHHLQSVPIYLLSQNIPEANNIVILGLGADDLFGTVTQYDLFRFETNFLHKMIAKYQKFFILKYLINFNKNWQWYTLALENYKRSFYPKNDTNNLLWSLGVHGNEEWASQYFKVTKKDIIKGRYNEIIKFQNRSIYSIISMLLYLGSASTTQAIWSKLGESQKKIFYYPYTNIDLINYAFSIPWDMKLEKPKNVLHLVARKIGVPEKIINRPKISFGINPKRWAEKDGVFESIIPFATKVFDEQEIRKMQSAESKKAMTYWNMLNYAIWKRLCINNEPLEVLKEEL
jgi:asparagine synthetase B (glutamine-hydrolysing)